MDEPTTERPRGTRVIVVGSGFAGIAMGVELRRRGITDFVILERAGDVGGTWRDNTYPGATCDVPSRLYSLSFAPNADWTHSFSPQKQIQAYLRRVADEYGLREHCVFSAEVRDARWDAASSRWHVDTPAGAFVGQFLVLGTGALSDPTEPQLPGAADFAGTTFHSARWDHDHDLRGRRVAVVGTGASAVQFIPEIAPDVAALAVFQRTAPWVVPRHNRALSERERWVYRNLPGAERVARATVYTGREGYVIPFARWPRLVGVAERVGRRHLEDQVSDPSLRAKLRPSFRFGCKRVLLSDDYYPALQRDNVELVTEPLAALTPTGIVTADGRTRDFDTIIYATGFRVTSPLIAERVHADGRSLAQHWAGTGMRALRGSTVPGFPNLFLIVGPNTGLGHTSIIYMIESQVAYIGSAIHALDRRGARSLAPREAATDAFNASIQTRLARSVWNTGGCRSWYLDAQGRNSTLWPDFTFRFRRATRRLDPAEYEFA